MIKARKWETYEVKDMFDAGIITKPEARKLLGLSNKA